MLEALYVDEFVADTPGVAIPRAEPQLVVRFGLPTSTGLDVHVMGARERAHRKLIRAGQRAVIARLRLGARSDVLGVPPACIAGRVVVLEALWGEAAARALTDQLAHARDVFGAAAVVDRALAERVAASDAKRADSRLVLAAAEQLQRSSVRAVADDLMMSERNLRRVFRDAVGMSPKAYARLTRFHRALRAASERGGASWASIAALAGYYDQAHLIAEFREIAGATPRALLRELAPGGA